MSKKEYLISVDDDGRLMYIYDDALIFLSDLGTVKTSRASHVEPTNSSEWEADMSPVHGPTLGPFKLRQEALAAEVTWLQENIL